MAAGLEMTGVDLQRAANSNAHRTMYYETTNSNDVIARRGQDIKMIFSFNKPVRPADSLTIIVETGPKPSTTNNSKATMVVSNSGSKTAWSAARGSSSGNSVPVTLYIPVTAIVGDYKMTLKTTSGGKNLSFNVGRLYVLCNAWATDDQVYMANEAQRQEYVLNDTGTYWFGGRDNFSSSAWAFGQFDKGILDACCTMLTKSSVHASNVSKDISYRSDSLHLARALSAMVNSNDDKGVIVGNWSGNYKGGVVPTQWNGSAAILRQWMKSGPVKFGQCWVYGGVLCTALRCLGIPARMITNFESAHDTDGNLVIDTYYLTDGSRDTSRTNDSVWNFHVWNEMWSIRPDIGSSYNGWQVVDATPQELSGGIFCLGPCAQKAVKEGEVTMKYDTQFVYAEVNAVCKDWMVTDQGTRLLRSRPAAVGWNTSTKAVGSDARVDVTNEYKYPEGSAKEDETYKKALDRLGLAQPTAFSMAVREIPPQFSAAFKYAETQVGQDLHMELVLQSTADDDISVTVNSIVNSVIYTNAKYKEILTETQSVTLGAKEEKSIPIKVTYNMYKDNMSPDNMIDFQALCEDDINRKLMVNKVVKLENLPLIIKNTEQAKVHTETSLEVIFTNTLNQDVTDCILQVDGSGLLNESLIIKEKTIKHGQSHTFKVKINPKRDGERCIIADLSATGIPSVKAYLSIPVAPE
ncbi:protein-glutamine gamma-glutamyltransferase E-like isoform X2 [Eleutherodactylus coqui]|uniref:protein-glutamine gamma-glutamyltransferase n=1 Tax=Eleutherodactylus coqui TaxID=57060 RepID=A0A8J6K3H3_ELECQ|nr:hypothetical protein GDO78_004314 [Eleutherodactylus coqui]